MDKVIKQILEIDRSAVEVNKEAEIIIKLKDKELEERLSIIEQDNLEQAKEKGNTEYERIVNEGKKEAEKIAKMAEQKIKKLEEVFDKKFDTIQNKIFEQLFAVKNQ